MTTPWCALCVSSMIKRDIILLAFVVLISWVIWRAFTYMYMRGSESRRATLRLQTLPNFYQHLLTRIRGAGFGRQLHVRWVRDRMGVWTMRAERKA